MEDSKLSLVEHLSELRNRIVISIITVLVVFIFLFNYSEYLFDILTIPLKAEIKFSMSNPFINIVPKKATSLVFLAPAEAFWMHMKVSFIASVIISLPMIFFQIWRFISPGLIEKEKRYLLPFIFFSTFLFLIGALFCFFIILPFAMTFLLGYKTGNISPMISVGSYIDFCLKFILAFGAVFELPLILIFLTRFGLVTPQTLAKNRKYAILITFIVAAVLTPTPDAFNQILMAVPMILLYEIGILLSRIIYRNKKNA